MKRDLSIARLYELVDVDTLRGIVFARVHRFHSRRGRPLGCFHDKRRAYLKFRLDGRAYLAHRVVWAFAHGQWPPAHLDVDHINGNKSDNRLCNLRLATRRQNLANRRACTFGFTRYGAQYRARIKRHGRLVWLGSFDTAEDAQLAYRRQHAADHGEFSPYYEELKNEAS